MVYSHNRISFGNKTKLSVDTGCNIDKPWNIMLSERSQSQTIYWLHLYERFRMYEGHWRKVGKMLMGRLHFGMKKMFKLDFSGGCTTLNMLKSLNWKLLVVWYKNCILIKLSKKIKSSILIKSWYKAQIRKYWDWKHFRFSEKKDLQENFQFLIRLKWCHSLFSLKLILLGNLAFV